MGDTQPRVSTRSIARPSSSSSINGPLDCADRWPPEVRPKTCQAHSSESLKIFVSQAVVPPKPSPFHEGHNFRRARPEILHNGKPVRSRRHLRVDPQRADHLGTRWRVDAVNEDDVVVSQRQLPSPNLRNTIHRVEVDLQIEPAVADGVFEPAFCATPRTVPRAAP